MATYVLVHGAGSDSWYWHLLGPELRARGNDVVAPDLPCDDDTAGLSDYADVVLAAIGDRTDLVVVAQSLAGFTAPIVCDRVPASLLILVAAMVPLPGESPGEWWANTRWEQARREAGRGGGPGDGDFDPLAEFFHDVSPEVVAEAVARGERKQSRTPFAEPWPLVAWPSVPTRFLLCRNDRFFPAEFMRRVVRERLKLAPDEMDTGHLPALSNPGELADRLEGYRLGSSSANLELVRSIYAGWEQGDFSSVDWADPEIEFGFVDGPEPGRWTGLRQMSARFGDWLRAWRGFRAEPEQYLVVDDRRILVLVHNSGRGRTSGLELEQRSVANFFEVRGGAVTRLVIYWDRDRARADLGLGPEPG